MREIQLVGRKYQYFSVGGKQKKKLVGQETAVVKVDDEDVAGLKMWEWKFAPKRVAEAMLIEMSMTHQVGGFAS